MAGIILALLLCWFAQMRSSELASVPSDMPAMAVANSGKNHFLATPSVFVQKILKIYFQSIKSESKVGKNILKLPYVFLLGQIIGKDYIFQVLSYFNEIRCLIRLDLNEIRDEI